MTIGVVNRASETIGVMWNGEQYLFRPGEETILPEHVAYHALMHLSRFGLERIEDGTPEDHSGDAGPEPADQEGMGKLATVVDSGLPGRPEREVGGRRPRGQRGRGSLERGVHGSGEAAEAAGNGSGEPEPAAVVADSPVLVETRSE